MAIYGHKFKSRFESEEELRFTKREWALSLRNFSENEVMAAVERCKEAKAWMPEIAEFLDMLHDANGDFGLPGVRDAYTEACMHADHPVRHHWSHPAVYHAGRETGWFLLRTEEESRALPAFRYHYEVMCRRVREGETLDHPVAPALEDKQANTVAEFIQWFTETHGLAPEEGASLLYYLTLPEGTRTRTRLYHQAQAKADQRGLGIRLPESTRDRSV